MGLRRRGVLSLLGGSLLTGIAAGSVSSTATQETNISELSGSGTEADPYVVTTASELQAINDDLAAHYELDGDIDASATAEWNGGDGFKPIGSTETEFTGTFDGHNHTITGLTIHRSEGGSLFHTINNATIERVSLTDVEIQDGAGGAGLVGVSRTGTIRDVSVSGTVTGEQLAAGVAVHNVEGGTISEASAAGDIECIDAVAGGVVGVNHSEATIEKSSSEATVTGGQTAGGLVGVNANRAQIRDSYAVGDVTSDLIAGGLVGGNTGEATISKTYAANTVAAGDMVGGLLGYNTQNAIISASYWDTNLTDGPGVFDQQADSEVTGLTTAEMQGESATETMAELDFESTWAPVTEDYPKLETSNTTVNISKYINDNNVIGTDGLNTAVADYLKGHLTSEQFNTVVSFYLSGESVSHTF
ncbi:GLUG motif-containing protein [Natrinema amylolyticum]|uniref:GLUG motif-containing protein n=1 Tax=Natrinema amylolyticum TaxID=2878679 RepID=UPI001CFAAD9E|nr:GLUG motif-containing protein [Natrinema amylolyticum]